MSYWGSCLSRAVVYLGSCLTCADVLHGQLSTWAVVAWAVVAWAVVCLGSCRLGSPSTQDTYLPHIKGDIHSDVLSTQPFLKEEAEMFETQN